MFEQRRWPREAWIPVIAGLCWLWLAGRDGVVGFLFSIVPGCLLLSSGVSTLLYPGERRILQFAAAGGVLGVVFALPAVFFGGLWAGLGLGALSAASFVVAGTIAVWQEPHEDDVPTPEPSLRLALEVAVDEAILASMALRQPMVMPADHDRIRDEVHAARMLFRAEGWLEEPARYHATPPALDDVDVRSLRAGRCAYEHVSFESGYEPHADEPGRGRWLSYANNRTAHAWVMRHPGPPRPWLVCIHGYEMGVPRFDLRAFDAHILHHRHGLNLLLPILPLHGPRKIGRQSGQGYLTGNFLDTVHAEAQAMWDIRRLLTWVRAQGGEQIGVYGLSLGGYNTALLTSLDDGFACAIAGIPATDFIQLTFRHGPPLQVRFAERHGLVHDEVAEMLRVVSPMALEPRMPLERRYLFAAVADRIVPAEHPRNLWRHWGEPRMVWYQGGHLTFRAHRGVGQIVEDALRESGLVGGSARAERLAS